METREGGMKRTPNMGLVVVGLMAVPLMSVSRLLHGRTS
jgi:hypothetical protein